MDQSTPGPSFSSRLKTFENQWPDHQTTARQLAALGHVCDRPPLESLEEGSRCISCGLFIPKEGSVRALEGPLNTVPATPFHNPKCIRLQLRIPINTQSTAIDYASLVNRWNQRRSAAALPPQPTDTRHPSKPSQTGSPLMKLPPELRLQIYFYILPTLPSETELTSLNRDSSRIIRTHTGVPIPIAPRGNVKSKLTLLQTCKTLHFEALDYMYAQTTFRVNTTRDLYLFLRTVGPAGRAALRAVDVTCGQREDAVAFALLGACGGMGKLVIRLARGQLLPKGAALWVTEGMGSLLALRGLEEVRFGECCGVVGVDLGEGMEGAEIIRREVMRGRGEVGVGFEELDL